MIASPRWLFGLDRQRGDHPVRERDELAVESAPQRRAASVAAIHLAVEGPAPGAGSVTEPRLMRHAFPVGRQRQRGIDEGDDLLRKIGRAAVADPLRVAAVGHEAGGLQRRHVPGHARLAGAELAASVRRRNARARPTTAGALRAGSAPQARTKS